MCSAVIRKLIFYSLHSIKYVYQQFNQHVLNSIYQGGGIKPPVTHSSSSSFNFADMFQHAIDPLGLFSKAKKSAEHFVDTGDHILNKGLDTANNLADDASDLAEGGGDLLKNLMKFAPLIIGGIVIITIIK
jgi:hypothetical protein